MLCATIFAMYTYINSSVSLVLPSVIIFGENLHGSWYSSCLTFFPCHRICCLCFAPISDSSPLTCYFLHIALDMLEPTAAQAGVFEEENIFSV